jgi:hypothetical protein
VRWLGKERICRLTAALEERLGGIRRQQPVVAFKEVGLDAMGGGGVVLLGPRQPREGDLARLLVVGERMMKARGVDGRGYGRALAGISSLGAGCGTVAERRGCA